MKTVLGILLASLAMYIWGSIWWMTIGMSPIKPIADDTGLSAAMLAAMPEPGVYFLPDPGLYETDVEAFSAQHETGPLAQVFFHPQGRPPMDPSVMIYGFLHMVLSVAIAGHLLNMVKGSLTSYGSRLFFVTGVGFLIAVFNRVGDMIWFYHHLDWTLFTAFFGVASWAIAGSILAAFIKPQPSA